METYNMTEWLFSGIRLRTDDVQALLSTQTRIRQYVPGFRFNLGFSGKYFHHGTEEENRGDDMILEHAKRFMWYVLFVIQF